jgi:pyruvate ferredoxin oxidoreductase alpha subunit/phenylglyoxylate dehydrogenase alpha subunit
MSVDPLTAGPMLTEFRHKQVVAMNRARKVIEEVRQEWLQMFGRDHGGLLDLYRMEDAEIALVCMGSPAGTARVVIDEMREKGFKVGMVRIRVLRPFPTEEIRRALSAVKAVGVIDRNVSFASGYGVGFLETKLAFSGYPQPPIIDFIGGLGGSDIKMDDIRTAILLTQYVADGGEYQDVTWLGLDEIDLDRLMQTNKEQKLKGALG